MKSLFFLLIFVCFPAAIFSQDIELGGTDLNGGDILDWNTSPILIPPPSPAMILTDSVVIQSNFENDAFYAEASRILEAAGFEPESGIDYRKSALKAHRKMHNTDCEIIVANYHKIFRSSTVPDNAKVTIYCSTGKSELNPADGKLLEKLKSDLAKQIKNAPKPAKSSAASGFTADERRVVNQFSRRSIPTVSLINGKNTLQQIADQSRMQKEEVAQIFAFMIVKGFAHVAKQGN